MATLVTSTPGVAHAVHVHELKFDAGQSAVVDGARQVGLTSQQAPAPPPHDQKHLHAAADMYTI